MTSVIAGLDDPAIHHLRHSGMRPLGRRPGIQHRALFWIPGSLAQQQIDFVNLRTARAPE
jgi:hypothetical protein